MLVHKETSFALPGVAISVALAPPLCVSEILAYFREHHLACQAFDSSIDTHIPAGTVAIAMEPITTIHHPSVGRIQPILRPPQLVLHNTNLSISRLLIVAKLGV